MPWKMVNDRLDALKAIRKDCYEDNSGVRISLEEKESFMSDFFNEIEETSSKLDQIATLTEEVKKKHSAILSVPSTSKKIKIELEDLMSQISVLSNKVKLKLKKLEQDLKHEDYQSNSANFRIKKIQYGALTRRFVDTMSVYNSIQVEYRQRCKDRIKRQLDIAGYLKSEDEVEEMLESGNAAVFTQELITETQQAKQSLEDIKDRHADIIKLEKNIKELHALFIDMAIMIENQGELIDHIEHNVESTADVVKTGNKYLSEGLASKKRARKMHMRFDGRLGFPGGLVDPGQTVLESLQRELVEEINLGCDLHPSEEDYLFSHVHPAKAVCNHFYGKELSEQHFLAMEKNVFTATDYGKENLGMIRVPLVPMPGGTKECFSKFLQNCFAGNAKDQLLNFLVCSNLRTLDKVQEAVRISKELC